MLAGLYALVGMPDSAGSDLALQWGCSKYEYACYAYYAFCILDWSHDSRSIAPIHLPGSRIQGKYAYSSCNFTLSVI